MEFAAPVFDETHDVLWVTSYAMRGAADHKGNPRCILARRIQDARCLQTKIKILHDCGAEFFKKSLGMRQMKRHR